VSSELLNALDQIEKEKGISKDILFETIEAALITAYKKNFSETAQNIIVNMDRETGEYEVFARYIVVEDDDFEDDKIQVIVEEAKKLTQSMKLVTLWMKKLRQLILVESLL